MVDLDQSVRNYEYDLEALEGAAGLKSLDYSQTITRNGFPAGDLPLHEGKAKRQRQRRDSQQRQKVKRAQMRAELDATIAEERVGHECEGSCQTCIDDLFAWRLIASFLPLIQQAITAQAQRAGRYVSTWDADIEELTTDRLHHEILRQRVKERKDQKCWGSEVLAKAAFWLSKQENLPGTVHAERVGEEVVAEAAKWLLSVTHNATLDAIRTWLKRYSSANGDALVRYEAVQASGTLYGTDEYLAAHKVDDLTMHGHRFPAPGQVNREYLATAISAWVTDRKLDPLTEVLLDEEKVNTDGTFRWTEHADKVWEACGLPMEAFANLPHDKAKAEAAKKAARNRYADLPEAVMKMASVLAENEIDLGERISGGVIKVTHAVTPEQRAKEAATRLLEVLADVL